MNQRRNREVLRVVVARFPKSAVTIRRLFQEHEEFQELCGDYADCVAALRRFRRQSAGRDDQIEQYTELRVSLEQELGGRIAGLAEEQRKPKARTLPRAEQIGRHQ